MAAGLGFKTFATGDILTAADANGYLMSQTVMVFADSTARTATITSPQEGMVTYLKDTNAIEYYSGSAWVGVGGSSTPTVVGCSLYNSSTITVTSGGNTQITYDSENFDTDGFHSTTTNTNRITIPTGKGGKYLLASNFFWGGGTNGQREVYLRKNGAAYKRFDANGNVTFSQALVDVMELSAGDYLYFEIYQNTGGNMSLTTISMNLILLGA